MLEFPHRVFDGVLEWYKNADAKAQIILSLNGILLAFITGSVFMEPEKLLPIVARFGPETWILLLLMCLTLTGSIITAIMCLWSRFSRLPGSANDKGRSGYLAPDQLIFFQHLSKMSQRQLTEIYTAANPQLEIEALSSQIPVLSKNVLIKHKLVNWGFLLAGTSLLLLMAVAVSYIIRAT
jgi:hypothetical protein